MGKDLVRRRTAATKDSKNGKPPKGYWRWNIRDPYAYARRMERQVLADGRELSPSRLKAAIEEDSYQKISVADCRAIMRKAGIRVK